MWCEGVTIVMNYLTVIWRSQQHRLAAGHVIIRKKAAKILCFEYRRACVSRIASVVLRERLLLE